MTCQICGSEKVRTRRISRTFGEGKELLVIENIPVVFCSSCGESYLTAATTRELQSIQANRHALAEERQVEVVRFEAA